MQPDFRQLFELPDDVAYFNCATLAPLMRSARQAMDVAVEGRARPWTLSNNQAWIGDAEERRDLFAALLGCDADGVALVPSASYGVAVAARNLTALPGERIVMVADDFPSDVYTWRSFARRTGSEIVTVARAADETWTQAVLAAMDERCAIVAVPNVHWTNGALLDLVAIGKKSRDVGARLVVDASQSIGAMPFDLPAVRPDFLVTVGYKWLLGPYGLSYLYVAPDHREGEPLEENWISREGSEDFSRLMDYVERYRPGARRFDVGERSALELTTAASAALRQVQGWGVTRIADTLRQITDRIEAQARDLGLTSSSGPIRGPHMLGVELPPDASSRAAAIFEAAKVHVSFRGRCVRIAPHLYTNEADISRLAGALAKTAAG